MKTLTLRVTGMTCMGCVKSVKNLLAALPGVSGVEVDLASGRVEVTHDPALCDTTSMRQAIEGGGYQIAA